MAPENRGSARVEEMAPGQSVEPDNRGGPRVEEVVPSQPGGSENRGGPRIKEGTAFTLNANDTPPQQIHLINSNSQTLSWRATITYTPGDPQWLHLGQSSGSIGAGATLAIAVSVSKTGMSGHHATVVFSWVTAPIQSASVVVTAA